jgi:8-oxo-dGTP pyrophosphatase MutT (NUDIX family)
MNERAAHPTFAEALEAYVARTPDETADLDRARGLLAGDDAWSREAPLHVTGSALVVHPPTRRVLLRWHQRLGGWFQVGGHADPGETDPFVTAVREGQEETGLDDLVAWPGPQPVIEHLVAVPVPAAKGEPDHEHLDVRYLLATANPEAIRPENPTAQLQWLDVEESLSFVTEENLLVLLRRAAGRLAGPAT